ncbi:MAG: acyl-ACP--UDP-N-acetylglucosamine O-acyltransferase [Bacteriovoracaceae bacterium]|nr:acyl-ACP--UDP-N-acetylglucosamine O-acyltransferase [Bacteriovoracaceae bacterium]
MSIHSTAIIEEGAKIGENVTIGPFCLIGKDVVIGDNNTFKSHVVIEGHTTIGNANMFHEFCSIGVAPQDKSYKGEPTQTIIGNNNLFREGVTVHRATTKEVQKTIIGNNGYFMAHVHFAHDCVIGDNVTLANGTMCAGHVHLGDNVQMGGACGVTPFCHVGKGAFIGAASAIDKDIPPFFTAMGNRIKLKGINIIGLKRMGSTKEQVSEVIEFYRVMESSTLSPRAFVDNKENIEEYKENALIQKIVAFISESKIGVPPFLG